jgi:hypothetical protein
VAIAITPRVPIMSFDPADESFILAVFHCQLASNSREPRCEPLNFYESSCIDDFGTRSPACDKSAPMTP